MIRLPRTAIAALALSASGLVGIAVNESYTDQAVIPVKGDVPTVGFGSTTHEDGSPVRMGDRTTPPRALVRLASDADRYAQAVKQCAPVPMYQYEFDAYVSLAYNIGPEAFCNSSLRARLTALDYEGACAQILRWDRFKGRRLPGLTKRRQREYRLCMGEA